MTLKNIRPGDIVLAAINGKRQIAIVKHNRKRYHPEKAIQLPGELDVIPIGTHTPGITLAPATAVPARDIHRHWQDTGRPR